ENAAHDARPVFEAAEDLAAQRAVTGQPRLRERERGPHEPPALGAAPCAEIGMAEVPPFPRAVKLCIEPDTHGPPSDLWRKDRVVRRRDEDRAHREPELLARAEEAVFPDLGGDH